MTTRKSDSTSKSKTAKKAPAVRSTGKAVSSPKAVSPPKAPPKPKLVPVVSKPEPAPEAPRHAKSNGLHDKDLKHLEHLLLEERQRLLRELGHLENHVLKRSLRETSGELSGYSFHMADVGTDSMEREKAFHFASAEGRALLEVDDALRRLYGGAYGICDSCGNPVGKERLEVVPHARLCRSCKEKEERAQVGRTR